MNAPRRPRARWLRGLDAWLLSPGDPRTVAVLRAGLVTVMLVRVATGPYRDLAGQPEALFRPPLLLAWLPHMPPAWALASLQVAGVLAALAVLAGRRRPDAFAVAWASYLVLAGLRGSLGKVLHNDVLPLLASVPLLAAPDATLASGVAPTRRHGWPARASALVVVSVYWIAGMQKLRHSGLAWVTSDNMRWILYGAADSPRVATDAVARFVADRAWLATTLAGSVLATEVLAPAALVVRRGRWAFVAAAVALHAGTWLALGLDYWAWALTVVVVIGTFRPSWRSRPPGDGGSGWAGDGASKGLRWTAERAPPVERAGRRGWRYVRRPAPRSPSPAARRPCGPACARPRAGPVWPG